MQHLNILTTVVHEGYQTSLAKTGHNFFSVPTPERPHGWRKEERPIPENWKEIDSDKEIDKIDLILINTIADRKFGMYYKMKFNCPIVEMFHCFPYPLWANSNIMTIKNNLPSDRFVFATKECANMWGYSENDRRVSIVGHTANEDIFKSNYEGSSDIILSVAYDFKERDLLLGYSEWKEIVNGFNWLHIGNEDFAKKATAEELANDYYKNSSVFINTAKHSPIPTALIEALRVGMPVLCVETPTNSRLFENSGIVLYTDIFDAKEKLQNLLEEKSLRMIKSGLNKQFYIENFSNKLFIEKWNNIFRKAINE